MKNNKNQQLNTNLYLLYYEGYFEYLNMAIRQLLIL